MLFCRKNLTPILVPIALIVLIQITRYLPAVGEWYAAHIYPPIATFLSAFSSLFPFSLGDCFIFGGCLFLSGYLILILCRREKRKKRILRFILMVAWIYIWFYFAWGLNYFRKDFYNRNDIPRKAYDLVEFRTFLDTYTEQLNASYTANTLQDPGILEEETIKGFNSIAENFGVHATAKRLKAKPILFSGLMSKMGISGYMGPFFCECNLNRENRPEEYPAVYVHESAHKLGITEEAEANFYAFLVCSRSSVPEIRYSGYFSLFGYIAGNARRILPEEEYVDFIARIRPEIKEQYNAYRTYWQSKYSPLLGDIQEYVYNAFLKSNRISSGTKNYSEVVSLLISEKNNKHKSKK